MGTTHASRYGGGAPAIVSFFLPETPKLGLSPTKSAAALRQSRGLGMEKKKLRIKNEIPTIWGLRAAAVQKTFQPKSGIP